MIQLTLTLKMTTAQVVETSVTVKNNSPIQDYVHPDDQTQPTIDTTLCQIATDLTTTFYQIPLAPKLVKYCSMGSSWIPIQWWVCQAQKLHWKSSCVVYLKILFHERVVAKISNISILRCLLTRGVTAQLEMSGSGPLRVQPQTLCIPRLLSTPNLPWCLAGTLQAFLHQITALALCSKPETVGPSKVLHLYIQSASLHYTPVLSLASTTWHCHHRSSVSWEDQLVWWSTFTMPSQPICSLTLPCLDNQLWITKNGAVKTPGITTTMYMIRDNTLQLTSLSSTKLWSCQVTWLPCEIEALSIPAAMKHYSSYSWKHQPAFSLTIKHVCGHLKSSVVVSFPQTLVLPPSFPPSVGAKPLFIMLLEPLSYHLTLPVAMPVSATTQLAKFAASSNTPRILWFSVHLSKAY